MVSLKAHFDGRSIVLDEPATLATGQSVRVIVETGPSNNLFRPPREADEPGGNAFRSHFTPVADLAATLMNGDDWDESAALHIDPLDAVPADFVRHAGSAAGQIKMADDFDTTPDDFGDDL